MRSQRLALLLATLLVLSLIVTAGLGLQLRELAALRQRVENFEAERAQQRAQYEETIRQLKQQADDIDAELSKTQSTLRELQRNFDQVRRERDELQTQRNELEQRNKQLEQLIRNLQSMNRINEQVVGLRGLAPKNRVPRDVLTRSEYRQRLIADMETDFPAEVERRERAKLVALDMIDPDLDLRSAIIEDLAMFVLGFYDPSTKELYVISDRETMGVEDRITYAHEYTHFLQDEAFDLAALQDSARSADESLAIRALIEGDASLSMHFWAEEHLTDIDRINYALEQLDRLADLFGSLSFSGADTSIESIGQFPYTYGTQFVNLLYLQGGWRAVDRAYSRPPRSTAQILHPELYFNNVNPVPVALPDLQAALGPGWEVVDSDVLGELFLRVYLEYEVELYTAIAAAYGWRGDRYAVLEGPDGARALAIRVILSNEAEAAQLFSTYTIYAEEKGGAPTATYTATRRAWDLSDRQIYLSQAGREVLILHAPDSATLSALRGAFPDF